jgi:hypothetical protein
MLVCRELHDGRRVVYSLQWRPIHGERLQEIFRTTDHSRFLAAVDQALQAYPKILGARGEPGAPVAPRRPPAVVTASRARKRAQGS